MMTFDPTAYENFKIIIEGSLYDADFTGDIKIINRSELVDLAVLSRKFEMQFELPDSSELIGGIQIRASLKNLADEILFHNDNLAAAHIDVYFQYKEKDESKEATAHSLAEALQHIWGSEREILTSITKHYRQHVFDHFVSKLTVSFNRPVREEQADDLYELVEFAVQSLKKLNEEKRKM
ncbi:MAG: hypothetical protein ACI4XS_10565 [Bacillus sp. (in: firmicutes)]